jgi:hypothetical protein
MQALTTIQNDLKSTTTTIKTRVETEQTIATAVQQTATASRQAVLISQDINAITKEVAEVGKVSNSHVQKTQTRSSTRGYSGKGRSSNARDMICSVA